MTNREIVEYSKQIDSYLKGKLDREAIDALWLTFLKNPVLFDYFEIELHLRSIILKSRKRRWPAVNVASVRQTWRKKAAYISVAAVVMFISFLGISQFFVSQSTAITQIALSKIDPGEMVAGTILRSEENAGTGLEVEVNRAIADAFNQNYDSSIARLNALNHGNLTEAQGMMIHLNLGILHYNNHDFALAQNYFDHVVQSVGVPVKYEEQARWYLANSYLKMGKTDLARSEALKVKHIEGRYQTRADDFLFKIGEINPM